MNKELQRIKIAEVCGWKRIPAGNVGPAAKLFYGAVWWRDAENNTIASAEQLPDYLNDLNAMHEAEKVLLGMCDNDPQADLWISYLANLVLAAPCCLREHATAAQRADAFCETLNLWEE